MSHDDYEEDARAHRAPRGSAEGKTGRARKDAAPPRRGGFLKKKPNYEDDYEEGVPPTRRRPTPQRSGKSKPKASKEKPPGRWSGGRAGVLALKITVWAILGVFLVNGVRIMLSPPSISLTGVSDAVAERLGIVEFPVDEAQSFAAMFTTTYLDNSPGREGQREIDLLRFLPKSQIGSPSVALPEQSLVSVPYLAAPPSVLDDNRAIFTFGAQISRESERNENTNLVAPRWVFVSVPVFADETGALRISGLPAFVPAPPLSAQKTRPEYQRASAETEEKIAADLGTFFEAWGRSDEAVLQRYVSKNPQVETSPLVLAGLAGPSGKTFLTFEKIEAVEVQAFTPGPNAGPISAQVRVVWLDAGVSVEQSYLMTLLWNDGTAWYVQDIQGGSFLG